MIITFFEEKMHRIVMSDLEKYYPNKLNKADKGLEEAKKELERSESKNLESCARNKDQKNSLEDDIDKP